MKFSLGGGDAAANHCEREYTDPEDDGHMESPKGSQKLLKHVTRILMVEQVDYSPLG